ncbi:hypothetical protein, partial [Streptomyces sp. NPDC001678]|uniref:hypothetical protein n=1 Tax=Streptomyces sp. NPDC001678 TaxID=3364599 RepID=UPI0036C7B3B7
FGTLLSSQGTDASFVLTHSVDYWGFPPGFPSLFPTLPDPFSVPYRFSFEAVQFGIHFRRPVGAGFPDFIRSL